MLGYGRVAAVLFVAGTMAAHAEPACGIPANIVQSVQSQLKTVVNLSDANGGIFKPNRMWSAIVDRQGVLCSVKTSAEFAPALDVWPGSRAIAIAKAGTANDFSNNGLALSTANLYGPTQPGGSLYGLNNSNPFKPTDLDLAKSPARRGGRRHHHLRGRAGWRCIVNGQVIGALGVERRQLLRGPRDRFPHCASWPAITG